MWDLVVYELLPWDSLIRIAKIGGYRALEDCLYMYSYVVQSIAESDLMGTYIPMCVRVL
jgi:hypothetical protein